MSETADAAGASGNADLGKSKPKFINLPAGSGLDFGEARVLTSARPTQVVVVAGPPDSGKTTLVT